MGFPTQPHVIQLYRKRRIRLDRRYRCTGRSKRNRTHTHFRTSPRSQAVLSWGIGKSDCAMCDLSIWIGHAVWLFKMIGQSGWSIWNCIWSGWRIWYVGFSYGRGLFRWVVRLDHPSSLTPWPRGNIIGQSERSIVLVTVIGHFEHCSVWSIWLVNLISLVKIWLVDNFDKQSDRPISNWLANLLGQSDRSILIVQSRKVHLIARSHCVIWRQGGKDESAVWRVLTKTKKQPQSKLFSDFKYRKHHQIIIDWVNQRSHELANQSFFRTIYRKHDQVIIDEWINDHTNQPGRRNRNVPQPLLTVHGVVWVFS